MSRSITRPRLSDNDRHFGPITIASSDSWRPLRLVLSSGSSEEPGNSLTLYLFGPIIRLALPRMIRPYLEPLVTTSGMTVHETHKREYGFSLSDDFFQLFYGPQTHSSLTTKSWSAFVPWMSWRFYRMSLYHPDGTLHWERRETWRGRGAGLQAIQDQLAAEQAVRKIRFKLRDYDGEVVIATTHIQEREWRFGTGWFRWLSLFRRPRVQRVLDISFDKETGKRKGSWKGGTIGTSQEMLHPDNSMSAMMRYCHEHGMTLFEVLED